jgi:hypothetical protein
VPPEISREITGRLTSIHVISGRRDIVVLAVSDNTMGGQFNCASFNVTLDGASVSNVWEIAKFVARGNCNARLIGVDNSQGGIDIRPCERVELYN